MNLSTTGTVNAPKCRDIACNVSVTSAIKRVFKPLCLAFLFVFAMQTAKVQAADEYFPAGNGEGTAESPFQITTPAELKAMALLVNAGHREGDPVNYLTAYYKLMNDIDLSVLYDKNAEGEPGWTPIGNAKGADAATETEPAISARRFEGVFDGNGKTVTGMYINQEGGHKGLFGRINGTSAVIRNLGVVGEVINSVFSGSAWDENVGGIVGSARGGAMIENCWFSGSVTGHKGTIGAIAGYLNPGTISKCWSDATVKNTANVNNGRLGGIVGAIEGQVSTVNNCYFSGTVIAFSSAERTGGIVGAVNPGRVSNCYVTGEVKGGAWSTGGIVGFVQSNTIIENCYITSAVSELNSPRLGGIVGRANNNSVNLTIRNCIVLSPSVTGNANNIPNVARIHGEPASGGTGTYAPVGQEAVNFARFTYSNYAWEGVKNFEDLSTAWGDCLLNNRQGKNVSVAEIRGKDFFKNIFEAAINEENGAAKWAGTPANPDATPPVAANPTPFIETWNQIPQSTWTFDGGRFPSLMGETVYIPEHLAYTGSVQAPTITTQPLANPAVREGEPFTYSVVATSPDGGGLLYQWYSNTTASNTGGTAIEGETGTSFEPETEETGTFYYYVVVTNSYINGDEIVGTPLASNVSTLIVTALPTYAVTINGLGVGATGGGTFLEGATVEVFAGTDPKGYDFVGWTVEGEAVTLDDPTNRTTTFVMPAVPVTLVAQFDRITGTEDLMVVPLKAWKDNGVLNVSGIAEGKIWRLYSISGQLVKQGVAGGDTLQISLETTGVYIIQSEGKSIKFVY